MNNLLNLLIEPHNRHQRRLAQFDAMRAKDQIDLLIEAEERFEAALFADNNIDYNDLYRALLEYVRPIIEQIINKNLKFWYVNEKYFVELFWPEECLKT